MAAKVEDERINKFLEDRSALPYNDGEIARRMGVRKSSYSSYINKRYPITNGFLKKFYTAFEEELKVLREKATGYIKPDDTIEAQVERIKNLERKTDKLGESHELIISDIRRLEKKLDHILDARLEQIEGIIKQLAAQGNLPVEVSQDKKGKKKSGAIKKTTRRKPPKGPLE